jgi:DNA repair photolyase
VVAAVGLRWRLADDEPQGRLFDEELAVRRRGAGLWQGLEFLEVRARRIINEVPPSSRMPFRYTVNAYRGCSHACAYCFARPTHAWLGLGTGEDFERRIVVKRNAVERLRAELAEPSWRGDPIAMGTNTDPYQHAEGRYRLTRGIVEVLSAARNPFSIVTKSTLVLGDLDRLAEAARRTRVRVDLSIGTLDEGVARLTEPGAPHPRQRLAAVARLNDAGVPCGVLVAPVLPGLSDDPDQLAAVVDACVDVGAVSVVAVPLHLRPGVAEHFRAFLAAVRPDLLELYDRRYGKRAYLGAADQRAVTEFVARRFAARTAPRRARCSRGTLPRPDAPAAGTAGGEQGVRRPEREGVRRPEREGVRRAGHDGVRRPEQLAFSL